MAVVSEDGQRHHEQADQADDDQREEQRITPGGR
jgi:hypothetical protein